jgi:uncharacterized protein (TIGR02145 family)
MKKILVLIAFFCTPSLIAQNYSVSFTGNGASTVVTYVKVENLRTGVTMQINGSDILRLNIATGIGVDTRIEPVAIKLFPNPMKEFTTVRILTPKPCKAQISVIDITGRTVARLKTDLENTQEFLLKGIKKGLYFINVRGNDFSLSESIISYSDYESSASVEKISNNPALGENKMEISPAKGLQEIVDMEYSPGDWIKFTGASKTAQTTYATVRTEAFTSDKTVNFYFVDCTDGDGNHYSVIQIGNQTWMSENLRTTTYNDATAIVQVKDNIQWANLNTPAYSWYNNDIANNQPYGALYNFYAVESGKLCPAGWHAGTDDEWTWLVDYAGGATIGGNKLKDSGTDLWQSTTRYVTNETGFTIVPGGDRYIESDGGYIFSGININAIFWTGTYPYSRSFYANNATVFRGSFGNRISGFSVRCVKN